MPGNRLKEVELVWAKFDQEQGVRPDLSNTVAVVIQAFLDHAMEYNGTQWGRVHIPIPPRPF
jgi:hypothetical protein